MAITPKGQEPAYLKNRMDTLFAKLDEAYPDKIIVSLQKDHKKWAERVTEFYRALGYPDSTAFLEAYGYTVQKGKAGRPGNNHMEIIQELQRRYPEGSPYCKLGDFLEANSDLKLKTIYNNSKTLFGMPFSDYLQSIGLLQSRDFKRELEELVAQLRLRYPDPENLPKTVDAVKKENADLPVEKLVYATRLNMGMKEYLQQAGVLAPTPEPSPVSPEEPFTEERAQQCIALLKERYPQAGRTAKDGKQLRLENPDIPLRKLNAYLKEHGESEPTRFYIRNQILQGTDTDFIEYLYCQVLLYPWLAPVWSISEIPSIAAGDFVWVKTRGQLHQMPAKVVFVQRYMGIDAPQNPNRTHLSVTSFYNEQQIWLRNPEEFPQICLPADFDRYFEADDRILRYLSRTVRRRVSVQPELFHQRESTDYVPAQIAYRGSTEIIRKLWNHLAENGVKNMAVVAFSSFLELSVDPDEILKKADIFVDAILLFPALKVFGILEKAKDGNVCSFYSENGISAISYCQEDCGKIPVQDVGSPDIWTRKLYLDMDHRIPNWDSKSGGTITAKYSVCFEIQRKWSYIQAHAIDDKLYLQGEN